MAIAVHALAPRAFPVLIIYVYLLAFIVRAVGFAIKKDILVKISLVACGVCLVINFIVLMADKWCRFFVYRQNT